jgi:hypothetical protein
MIRFAAGLAIIVFTAILGIYRYLDLAESYTTRQDALSEALDKRDQGKNLKERIVGVRKTAMMDDDARKSNVERLLDIGAPRLEWKTVGQALVRDSNKAILRYTFRITGPATYADVQSLLERMNTMPGFVVYRMCFACTATPRGTPAELSMVQIEGYLYAYDPATLY